MRVEQVILAIVVAYLIGAIPVAYLIGRLHGINVFEIGSGNMGAGNIARYVNKTWGAITWLLDSIKGIVAILIVRQILPDHTAIATMLGSIACIVGHIRPIFVVFIIGRFKGGKGAATAIGTWFLFIPLWIIAAVMSVWVLIVATTRLVSLAVLVSMTLMSLAIVAMTTMGYMETVYISYLLVMAMIFYRHKDNIKALVEGRERRLGDPTTY
jgi:glycerol-3-phosphate acyltransferase PlsY